MTDSTEQNEQWVERWREGRTPWHRDDVHPTLRDNFAPSWRRVFVPLCGATVDLDWLVEQGAEAIGAELSEEAARQVFKRLNCEPNAVRGSQFLRLSAGNLTIVVGDVFEATAEELGPLEAVWDRAALVAIEPERRHDYARLLRDVAPGADLLLEVFEYSAHIMEGPPHSIPDAFVRQAFEEVEQLDEQPVPREELEHAEGFFVRRAYRARL